MEYTISNTAYRLFFFNDSTQLGRRLFRKSLRTRDRRNALRKSKILWLIMDDLKWRYFRDPNLFGKAMTLLMEYEQYEESSWKEVQENFFDKLDEDDDLLLEQAIRYRLAQQNLLAGEKEEHLKSALKAINLKNLNLQKQKECSQNDLKISELIERWLEFKKSSLKYSSFVSLKKSITIFEQVISEICNKKPTISDLTEDKIRNYKMQRL